MQFFAGTLTGTQQLALFYSSALKSALLHSIIAFTARCASRFRSARRVMIPMRRFQRVFSRCPCFSPGRSSLSARVSYRVREKQASGKRGADGAAAMTVNRFPLNGTDASCSSRVARTARVFFKANGHTKSDANALTAHFESEDFKGALTEDLVEPIGEVLAQRLQVPLLLLRDARLVHVGQLRFRLRPAAVWRPLGEIEQVEGAEAAAAGAHVGVAAARRPRPARARRRVAPAGRSARSVA